MLHEQCQNSFVPKELNPFFYLSDVTGGDGIYSSMLSWNNWNRTQLLNNSITTTIRFCATGINGITAVGKGKLTSVISLVFFVI